MAGRGMVAGENQLGARVEHGTITHMVGSAEILHAIPNSLILRSTFREAKVRLEG